MCWQRSSSSHSMPVKVSDLQALRLLFILEIQYISWSQNTCWKLLIASLPVSCEHMHPVTALACALLVSTSSCSVVAVWMWNRTKRAAVLFANSWFSKYVPTKDSTQNTYELYLYRQTLRMYRHARHEVIVWIAQRGFKSHKYFNTVLLFF